MPAIARQTDPHARVRSANLLLPQTRCNYLASHLSGPCEVRAVALCAAPGEHSSVSTTPPGARAAAAASQGQHPLRALDALDAMDALPVASLAA